MFSRNLIVSLPQLCPLRADWSVDGHLEDRCNSLQFQELQQVGMTGFEPATSWSRTKRSSQAELHPVCGRDDRKLVCSVNGSGRGVLILISDSRVERWRQVGLNFGAGSNRVLDGRRRARGVRFSAEGELDFRRVAHAENGRGQVVESVAFELARQQFVGAAGGLMKLPVTGEDGVVFNLTTCCTTPGFLWIRIHQRRNAI